MIQFLIFALLLAREYVDLLAFPPRPHQVLGSCIAIFPGCQIGSFGTGQGGKEAKVQDKEES